VERSDLLERLETAATREEITQVEAEARAWLGEHPQDHQVAFSLLELFQLNHDGAAALSVFETVKKLA
jgi:DNA-binding SARP family transcriptional activator